MNIQTDWSLHRDRFGKLNFVDHKGERVEGVVPVRAFPISAGDYGFALVAADGRELAWVDKLDDVSVQIRLLITEELAGREFMPEIRRIHTVSSYATPSTWQVLTDRGESSFVLRGEEDIRRLDAHALLIADSHGIQFLIRDLMALDSHSRKILDRFL